MTARYVRWQVTRILKGDLDDEILLARTPTGIEEFLGKEWILMLSPGYLDAADGG